MDNSADRTPSIAALASFGRQINCVVFGGTGGIGRAISEALMRSPSVDNLFVVGRTVPDLRPPAEARATVNCERLDLADEKQLASLVANIGSAGPLCLAIVATGLLHDGAAHQPEKAMRDLNADALARSFQVNTVLPALIAKHTLPLLRNEGKSLFAALSARVGSISDNRAGGWYGYRASKAALNMVLKNLAIEEGRRKNGATILGLHPGTVDTGLSKPFQRGVAPDRLFSAQQSAGYLLDVIDKVGPDKSGSVIAWDGTLVPA